MAPLGLVLFSAISAAVFIAPIKTEQSRVVTILRPIVITQERKTPAYYVYQQAKANLPKKIEIEKKASVGSSKFLSTESIQQIEPQITLSQMSLTKTEYYASSDKLMPIRFANENIIQRKLASTENERLVFSGAITNQIMSDIISPEATVLSPEKKWANVRGKFELIEGVGVLDHHIVLKRVEEGYVRETGSINLGAGSYNIDIASPNGYLVAQIRDRNGNLVGEDRERLLNLQSRGSYYEGPYIKVGQPATLASTFDGSGTSTASVSKSASTKISSASNNNGAAFASLRVSLFDEQSKLDTPTSSFTNISYESSTISRIYDSLDVYQPMITIKQTGVSVSLPMFTKKWLSGVLEYISDLQKKNLSSGQTVIMGRLLQNGKPFVGSQVSLEGLPDAEAIYFDSLMIPNSQLSGTSENGYFMFVGLEAGTYNVLTSQGSQIFLTEENLISFQNIETRDVPVNKILRSFDAFSLNPLESEVISPDFEASLELINGTATYLSHMNSGIADYLVRPTEQKYLPMRYIQDLRKDYAHFPLIEVEWMDQVRTQKSIFLESGTGTIIGFVPALKYTAYLVLENYDSKNIVYFDQTGKIVDSPAVGGGFILFNVPTGAKEVVLQQQGTDKIFSQVFDVHYSQISVSHFVE